MATALGDGSSKMFWLAKCGIVLIHIVEYRSPRYACGVKQQELFRRGGARRGAGRKPAEPRARASHSARPRVRASNAMHVTVRVADDIPMLRQRALYPAIHAATANTAATQPQFRIVHLSIQNTHLHLVVEADDNGALARGMQSFLICAARRINKLLQRRGSVFPDHYHMTVIRSPTHMRSVLAYVMNNWRKHKVDHLLPGWLIDPYASGHAFDGWVPSSRPPWPADVPPRWLIVKPPKSWLLREGWKLGGGPISATHIPGRRPD